MQLKRSFAKTWESEGTNLEYKTPSKELLETLPLSLCQKCWYSFSVIFRTTSLQVRFSKEANFKDMLVCGLPTQNFQAGLVGRKFFFLLPVQVKDTILKLNYLQIEANNFFSEMTKKIIGSG